MPTIRVKLQTAVRRSFRVEQVAGMFDVGLGSAERGVRSAELEAEGARGREGEGETVQIRHELTAEVPGVEEEWTIGAIVGPSGSGKTTLARAAFGGAMHVPRKWPKDRATIDCFGDVDIKLLTQFLTMVGLGSAPAWLKPHRVLSTGERFRAEVVKAIFGGAGKVRGRRLSSYDPALAQQLAEAALHEDWVVVMDEFSGSLDRTVAKTASMALARFLRRVRASSAETEQGKRGLPRFVAVTCHTDILPWLAPDWVVEVGEGEMQSADCRLPNEGIENAGRKQGLLRWRPFEGVKLEQEVGRAPQALWKRFAGQHYLSGGLAASATCYAGWLKQVPNAECGSRSWGEAVAFCAVVGTLGHQGTKHITRLVVRPDFQGIGIGGQMLDEVAAIEAEKGFRVTITASHPAILNHCSRSPRWRFVEIKKMGSTRQRYAGREVRSSRGRAVAAFEYASTKYEGQSTKEDG